MEMEIDEALSAVDRLVEDWGGEHLKNVPNIIRNYIVETKNTASNKQMEKCFGCASCLPSCEHNVLFGSKDCSTIAKFKA